MSKKYIIESDFEYNGYRCVTTFGYLGHRCGYVGVPEGHPLYGKNYGDYTDYSLDDLEGNACDKMGAFPLFMAALAPKEKVRLELLFNVHGSLTYSSKGEYPVESDLWWLGFDCAHAGDGRDLDKLQELWGDDPSIQTVIELEKRYPISDDVIRDLEYVQQECRNLVDQIIEYTDKIKGEK